MTLGIEKHGDHWRWFDERGIQPGLFEKEAARWGSWITPERASEINDGEGLLIEMEDVRAAIRAYTPPDEFITIPRFDR